MMKALSKPLSSPGRPDKFPPPLLRFLRSNAGSRSRGRSRSSPIFHLRSKKHQPGGVIEATQEPSSPKVTCIGQVRVCRKQNAADANHHRRRRRRRRCIWFNKALFRCRFPKCFYRWFFRKWSLIFRSNCCRDVGVEKRGNCISRVCSDRKTEKIENVSDGNPDPNPNTKINIYRNYNISNYSYKIKNSFSSNESSETEFYRGDKNGENGGDVFGESKGGFLGPSSSSSPPRDALLLTRCRSVPYRSSASDGRFWAEEKLEEIERRKSSAESENSRFDGNSSSSSSEEIEKVDGLKANNVEIAIHHPLKLRRCKSEPARKGERFGITEEMANFLRIGRSERVISSQFPK